MPNKVGGQGLTDEAAVREASQVAPWWGILQLPEQETLETWVQSLGREDALEEEMAAQSSILAWKYPIDRGAWRATIHRVAKSWTQLSD